MVAERLGRLAARLVNAAEPAVEKVKASDFAQKLITEFERGRSGEGGDDTTASPADAPTQARANDDAGSTSGAAGTTSPSARHAATNAASHASEAADSADATGDAAADAPPPADEVDSLVDALSSVDWAKVRSAASEKGTSAAASMKKMAADVDWGKVQSGAAVVSSALIAAVASGQLPIGGRLAGPVARAILNDADLAAKVSSRLKGDEQPPDLRDKVRGD